MINRFVARKVKDPVRSGIVVNCDECKEDFELIVYEDIYSKYLFCPHCSAIYDIDTTKE